MKLSGALIPFTLALVASAAFTPLTTAAQGPGPYTAAQASAGATLFAAQCSQCHGAKLEGGSGPALKGPDFISQWSGSTADDVRDMIQTQMPLTNPGSLKPDQVVTLVAYLLQQNGYPAGDTPLTAAKMKTVKIVKQS